MPLVVGDSTEQLECGLQVLADLAHRRQVSAAVAVVGCTPDGYHVVVVEVVLVALVYELVGSRDQG